MCFSEMHRLLLLLISVHRIIPQSALKLRDVQAFEVLSKACYGNMLGGCLYPKSYQTCSLTFVSFPFNF